MTRVVLSLLVLQTFVTEAARTDEAGAFTLLCTALGGIAPGAYRLYASHEISENLYFDEDFMKSFITSGTPVDITAGSIIDVNLALAKRK